MVKEGVLERHGVDVIFGLHISSIEEVGTINYRPGGLLASCLYKGKRRPEIVMSALVLVFFLN